MRRVHLVVALAIGLLPSAAGGAVVPHGLFTEGMVLQQGDKAPMWGSAAPGEKVTVLFQEQEFSTTTGKDGKWLVELTKLKPGGPFEMKIVGSATQRPMQYKNVLVGEVWLCGGGSNMEWPLTNTEDAQKNISISKNPNLHLFTVPHRATLYPQNDLKGTWRECEPNSARNFSAVAFYYGQELQDSLKVPVGLIQVTHNGERATSSGTPAEAWIARHVLSAYSASRPLIDKFDKDVDHYFNVLVPQYIEAIEKYPVPLRKAQAERAENLPPAPHQPFNPGHAPGNPTTLYNGMIAPLIPYAIKGVIWYQGEVNVNNPPLYRTLLPALIKNWRSDWDQGEFPFLFVQLAPAGQAEPVPKESRWAELREAQLATFQRHTPIKAANTAMVVVSDTGEANNPHPRRKQPVGHRLALAARSLVYAHKTPFSGPLFDAAKIEGDKAFLAFHHVNSGLDIVKDSELKGFAMAGDDGVFHPAHAVIKDDAIVVTCAKVPHPKWVRYGWADFPQGNLWNRDGLPASPFRTDNLPK